MSNLISKKEPLERILIAALSKRTSDRFNWEFFRKAHYLIGIKPSTKFLFSIKRPNGKTQLLKEAQRISKNKETRKNGEKPLFSSETATWLLEEFEYEDFNELDFIQKGSGRRRLEVELSEVGANSNSTSASAIRLGLIIGIIKIHDVRVSALNDQSTFSAFELSSGEFQLFSTLLAIGFWTQKRTLLLIDEPENSLHPQWQMILIESIVEICEEAMSGGQIVISTHSPLIVGSVPEGSTIVDMQNDEQTTSLSAFGASSDELLLEQFGVGSSRNRTVINTIQKAVSLFEENKEEDREFKDLIPELNHIRNSLRPNDPFIEIIDALTQSTNK